MFHSSRLFPEAAYNRVQCKSESVIFVYVKHKSVSPPFTASSSFFFFFTMLCPVFFHGVLRGQSAGKGSLVYRRPPSPFLPPRHPHPKGDVDSHHGSRDSGQTCCHHSMHLGERQLADVWTDQEKGVRLEVGEKWKGWFHFSMMESIAKINWNSNDKRPNCVINCGLVAFQK